MSGHEPVSVGTPLAGLPPLDAVMGQHVLPLPADSFVGRARELDEVSELVDVCRLVTLTGPGGSGKTRLALAVAARQAWASPQHEAFFVDASPLATASLLPDRLARVMGLRPPARAPLLRALADAVAGRPVLVVLDNLEHLTDAPTVIGALLGLGPQVRWLATSRGPLHVRGEHVYPVSPLALPSPRAAGSDQEAASVVLFADRASAAAPSFRLTEDTRPLVSEICRQLDGLPLAIELAADWMRVMTPADLLARLNRRLDLLSEPGGDRPARHRALRATIDWSYQLLDEPTRASFRALSVFRGGWDLAGAAGVCQQPDEIVLLGQFAALVDSSLIEPAAAVAGHGRYRMLESLREFALEQLEQCGAADACRDRQAEYVHALAAESFPHLTGREQLSYLDRLEADRDTISAVLHWLAATGQSSRGLMTAAMLWRFWHLRGHLQQGRQLLEELLATPSVASDGAIRADALTALAGLAYWQLDYAAAHQHYDSALALYADIPSEHGIAASHYNLAFPSLFDGDPDSARAYFALAMAEWDQLHDQTGRANALAGLALVDHATGDLPTALQRATDALAQQRQSGSAFDALNTLGLLGSIQARLGRLDDAQQALREALTAHSQAGNASGIAWMLQELAAVAADQGEFHPALRLSGAADRLESDLGGGANMAILQLPQRIAQARQHLSADEAERAWQGGRTMSLHEAVIEGLTDHGDAGGNDRQDSAHNAGGATQLSARERELITLIARGLTDAQVAQQLFISIRTVRSHLDRIRDKTGCRRRADLTRLALQAHLV